MRYAFPYHLESQPEGGFTVTFPDVPEPISQGDTREEAATMAEDAVVTALSFLHGRRPRPASAFVDAWPAGRLCPTSGGGEARIA